MYKKISKLIIQVFIILYDLETCSHNRGFSCSQNFFNVLCCFGTWSLPLPWSQCSPRWEILDPPLNIFFEKRGSHHVPSSRSVAHLGLGQNLYQKSLSTAKSRYPATQTIKLVHLQTVKWKRH